MRVAKKGTLAVTLDQLSKISGTHELMVSINNQVKKVNITEQNPSPTVGEWMVKDTGYVAIHLKRIKKSAPQFPTLGSLVLSGTAIDSKTTFVKDN